MRLIVLLLLMATVQSCGKSNSNAGLPIKTKKILPLDGSNIEGLYMAKFFTMNAHINGMVPGSATLMREEDKFFAYVRLFGGAPNVWHQQNIHEGPRCPNMGDDLNGDGYIDMEEGNRVWGKAILPLDSNIGSQKAGANIYPVADETGSYWYERVTSFERMFDDLKDIDHDEEDNLTKLSPDKGLDFEGKVIVVMGTNPELKYPETIAPYEKRLPHQSLPITCGVFKKVTKVPGSTLPEDVPDGEGPEDNEDMGSEDHSNPRDREVERNDDGRDWYGRIRDWWRRTWNRERGDRRENWGNGRVWPF